MFVGYPIDQIIGCKLPSHRQVSWVSFYNLPAVKLTIREPAKLAIREVFIFWEKARIPTKLEQDAINKLEKRRVAYSSNIPKENIRQEKIKTVCLKVAYLFDIAQKDALALIKSEENKAFPVKEKQKGLPDSMTRVDLKLSRRNQDEKELAQLNQQIQEETFDIGDIF